jgi:hypothetical protein
MPGAGVMEKEGGKRKVSFFAAKERERERVCVVAIVVGWAGVVMWIVSKLSVCLEKRLAIVADHFVILKCEDLSTSTRACHKANAGT